MVPGAIQSQTTKRDLRLARFRTRWGAGLDPVHEETQNSSAETNVARPVPGTEKGRKWARVVQETAQTGKRNSQVRYLLIFIYKVAPPNSRYLDIIINTVTIENVTMASRKATTTIMCVFNVGDLYAPFFQCHN